MDTQTDSTPVESLTEHLHDAGADVVTDAIDGTPIPELSGDAPADPPLEALASGLTFQAKLYAAANQHERMAENPDGFFGPFDPRLAWDRLAALSTQVEEARVDHERAKASAKTARDRYEEANNELNDLIKELKAWERGEERQPNLKVIDEPGQDDENAHERRQRLTEALKEKRCFLLPTELELLERGDLDTLDAWITMADGVVPPELLKNTHVAGPGLDASSQVCQRCGMKIAHVRHDDDAFPEGAFVGLDCTGGEEARQPKRGKKRKKGSPEAEAVAQVADAKHRGVQKATRLCECGLVATVRASETPGQFPWSCACGRRGEISWGSDEPPTFEG